MTATYTKLLTLAHERGIIHSIEALLEWDQSTYMPDKALSIRSEQKALLATLSHKKKMDPLWAQTLFSLIDKESGELSEKAKLEELGEEGQANLREWRRDYFLTEKLPLSFIKKWIKATTLGSQAWEKAKKKNDFSLFAPHLEEIVTLAREKSSLLQETGTLHPYDPLLDLHEPGMTSQELDLLFQKLLPPLIALKERMSPLLFPPLEHEAIDDKAQCALGRQLLHDMGLEKSLCRLDLSAHPFCMAGHPQDVRLTTHTEPLHCMKSISAILHEGGHGLYEAHLPLKHFGTPLAEATSLGIHESQSRLWETLIGLSLPFWKHYFPKLQKEIPSFQSIDLMTFYQGINKVNPSCIRVGADEVTYCLHVALRFEIEKELIEGSLSVHDLPKVWNKKMEQYLGVTPRNDREGCLQDVHWSLGLIGYFPTYALGNLYASHFIKKWKEDTPQWEQHLEKGEVKTLRDWLKEKVHTKGKRYKAKELLRQVCQETLSVGPYIQYLEEKYRKIEQTIV